MNSVRIIRPIELRDYHRIAIRGNIPLITEKYCPACRTALTELFALMSESLALRIRLGVCEECGYVGYIDRPSEQWMQNFYASGMWDKNHIREGICFNNATNIRKTAAARMFRGLMVPPEALILDVGAGYGEMLLWLKKEGYAHLIGIEPSPHRAQSARVNTHVDIMEDTNIFGNNGIKADVIICQHVLEHVYRPQEMIEAFAKNQKKGGYLIVVVPTVWQESVMAQIAFIPHLHSFSPISVERMLVRAGYRIIHSSVDNKADSVNIIGEKTDESLSFPESDFEVLAKITRKFGHELGFDKKGYGRRRILWWYRKKSGGGQINYYRFYFFDKWKHLFLKCLARTPLLKRLVGKHNKFGIQYVEAEAVDKEVPRSSPMSFIYPGPVILFYK